MLIKDENKVVSKEINDNVTVYTLLSNTHLGDVFENLPAGIVNKTETGMGATTLELKTARNSIIVEPIKITASSKAYKHDALYVGSETKYHTQKVKPADIQSYVNDEKIVHKKILVVADSLWRVIEAIGERVYEDYFLLIDEVDTFQMDSSFRSSMEDCLDYYKRFLPTKRAMVSATLLEFSDPELQNEPLTTIKYEKGKIRKISLIHTSTVKEVTFDILVDKLKKSTEEKWLVAYNSVTGCNQLANELVSKGIIGKESIKLLCSSNSKEKVQEYYHELNDEVLPERLNFITSAYFTGFDLKEDFNLISISSSKNPIHVISEKRLKQIAGRCRNTLLSETIIYDTLNNTK